MNPALFSALQRRFGDVKISNEGMRKVSVSRPDRFNRSKMREEIVDGGEYYRVCCPYCGDKRHRLYVNHCWNTDGSDGRPYGRFMIHCFNENCDMAGFRDELKPYINHLPKIHRPDEACASSTVMFKRHELPGKCVPIIELPDFHPALNYLRTRERNEPFDPKQLGEEWGLQYCVEHPNPLIAGRIIFPVYKDGILVGWQARACGNHKIKYYTMPGLNKKAMLVNGDRARHYKIAVIVEGTFDAMSVGPCAIPLLGKSVSYIQRLLLQQGWGEGTVAFMLDPDALEDMKRTAQMFDKTQFKGGIFQVNLPEGVDPGRLSRSENWGYIYKAAAENNVTI